MRAWAQLSRNAAVNAEELKWVSRFSRPAEHQDASLISHFENNLAFQTFAARLRSTAMFVSPIDKNSLSFTFKKQSEKDVPSKSQPFVMSPSTLMALFY